MTIVIKLNDGHKMTEWNVTSIIKENETDDVKIGISDKPDKTIPMRLIDKITIVGY